MSSTWAALFPGQGKITDEFLEILKYRESYKEIYDCACHYNNIDFFSALNDRDIRLVRTNQYYAALLTLTNLAVLKWVRDEGVDIVAHAGYSIGQYSAIYASGSITLEDLFQIVLIRSQLMSSSLEKQDTGMVSVIGVKLEDLEICLNHINDGSEKKVVISNYNCPGNYTVAGDNYALESFQKEIKKYSPRKIVKLDVSGAWHSYFLKNAGFEFKKSLSRFNLKIPVNVVDNVSGEYLPKNHNELLNKLSEHIYMPVLWESSIEHLGNKGFSKFLELGHGKNLSTFNFFINRDYLTKPINSIKQAKIINQI